MAGFFYFFEGAANAAEAKERLARTELGAEFPDGAGLDWAQVRAGGPGRGDGALAVRGVSADRRGAATWVEVPEMRIGWLPDDPPTPAELEREVLCSGHSVKLNDDRDWTVPVLKLLPQTYGVDAEGRATTRTARRFAELAAAGDRILNWLLKQVEAKDIGREQGVDAADEFLSQIPPDAVLSAEEGLQLAIRALCVNHRITRLEVLALELLDELNVGQVLLALIDWPTIKQVGQEMADASAKKKPAQAPGG